MSIRDNAQSTIYEVDNALAAYRAALADALEKRADELIMGDVVDVVDGWPWTELRRAACLIRKGEFP